MDDMTIRFLDEDEINEEESEEEDLSDFSDMDKFATEDSDIFEAIFMNDELLTPDDFEKIKKDVEKEMEKIKSGDGIYSKLFESVFSPSVSEQGLSAFLERLAQTVEKNAKTVQEAVDLIRNAKPDGDIK